MTKKRAKHLSPRSSSSKNAYAKRKKGSEVWRMNQVRLDEMEIGKKRAN